MSEAISCGISLDATETTPTPPSAITGSVTASSPEKTRNVSGTLLITSAICVMLPLASFTPMMFEISASRASGGRFNVRGGAPGYVVEDDGLAIDRFGDRFEMAILALLRRLVVVRRSRQDRVHSGARRQFFGFLYGIVGRVRGGTGHDRHASGCDFDSGIDDMEPFVVGKVGVSPVVPQGTRKSMPESICHATRLRNAASSIEPS